MAKVEAIALSDFTHGDINAVRGQPLRHRDGSLIDEGLANDLERAGLVRIRMTPSASPPAPGKAADDGVGQPSSASPAAPVLQTKTLPASKAGGSKTSKGT